MDKIMLVNITSKSSDLLISISQQYVLGYFNLSLILPDSQNIQFKNNQNLDAVLYILNMLYEHKFIANLPQDLIMKIQQKFSYPNEVNEYIASLPNELKRKVEIIGTNNYEID